MFELRIPSCHTDLQLIGYNSANKACSIYTNYVATSVEPNSTSTQTFYDAACFTCPTRCPSKAGVNLLDNAGFENYRSNIAPWRTQESSTDAVIVTPGLNSTARAGKFSGIDTDISDDQIWVGLQSFDVCPNTLYTVSFDYKFTGPAKDVQGNYAGLLMQAGDFYFDARFEPNRDLTYKPNTLLRFTDFMSIGPDPPLSPDDSFSISEGLAVGGVYPHIGTLDNAVITPYTGSLTPASSAPNLIKNPSFENKKIALWTTTVYADQFTGARLSKVGRVCTTSCFLRANLTVSDSQVNAPVVAVNQTISGLTLGKTYLLSFKYYTTVPTNVVLRYGAADIGDVYNRRITLQGSGTWKRPVVARQTTTMLQIVVRHAEFTDTSYTVDFDEFSLKAL